MIATTLVTGANPASREAAIRAAINAGEKAAVILEGIPDVNSGLDSDFPGLQIARIAPGCLCCTGNLTMRVTLNRVLRSKPERLFIGLATSAHIGRIHDFLAAPPYDKLLALTKDLHA